jgi:hypothetical protein
MKGDLALLVAGLANMRSAAHAQQVGMVIMAVEQIRRAGCFPEAYVDGLRDEMLQMLGAAYPSDLTTSVYLAFHGLDGRAAFMKAGIAKDVKKRMRELYTGNPMPRLWTYSAKVEGRGLAYRVESALHEHLRETATSGEWFQVHGLSEDAAAMVADSLSEVASQAANRPVVFKRQEC